LGEKSLQEPTIASFMHLLKFYIQSTLVFKKVSVLLYVNILTLLSAGPVGNIYTRTPPNWNAVAYPRFGWFFYMLQSLFFIPMTILWLYPALVMIYLIVYRVWFGSHVLTGSVHDPHRMSDISFVLLGVIMWDTQFIHIEVSENFSRSGCFPFINPFVFFRIMKQAIINAIAYILSPFKLASKGALHYIRIVLGFIRKNASKVWDKISRTITSVASAIYLVIKKTLETLWKAVVLASV
jgi:hypothetical protein